ncbi:hypothetical protein FGG20_gp081 [Mycobacterium phage Baka]|uniref:Uncharacterized protein n=2 Tax=Omegavirus baka TaxID=1034099 RepID=A0A3S9UAU9_9CAUD|nr:hypothetical protein FGG20_gp081 [Mycobacterium phage Baka]AEK08138.1 hypothetical protein PBI_BAKA_81 [Mycobacterium phage Baka]AZS07419.1 hypothetical protein PBI_DUKE13_79 [Mycobacterium phage Duke13]
MSDVVERAKATLEGVTEGPWTFQHWGGQNQNGDYAESILFDGNGETMTYGLPDVDGEFIASARSLVPELIAEVELKSAQLAEWRAQYDAINAENERLRAQETRIRELCAETERREVAAQDCPRIRWEHVPAHGPR